MGGLPDPEWYLDNVLAHAEPGVTTPIHLGPAARWEAWWSATAHRLEQQWPAGFATSSGFALTTPELAALGISRQQARTRVLNGEWSAPCRGVVSLVGPRIVGADSPAPWVRRRREHAAATGAVARLNPGHLVGGRSAAILRGLPTGEIPSVPELNAVRAARTRGGGRGSGPPRRRPEPAGSGSASSPPRGRSSTWPDATAATA